MYYFSNSFEYMPLGYLTIWDKKFNNIGDKYTTKTIKTKHISAEMLKSLQGTGDIKLLSTGKFDSFTDNKNLDIINDLEIIAIPSGGTANIKYYSGKFIDSGNLLAITSNANKYNLKYIYYYLLYNLSLIEENFRGISIKHPQMQDILEIQVPIFNIEIQNKIVSILTNIDTKIEFETTTLKKLKTIKKAMLEKMFPKENSNMPKLRFKGFTETWEQRKLKDIANKVIEKNNNFQYTETFTNSAEFGIINQQDFFSRDIAQINNLNTYYIVKKGDFVYNPRISILAPVGPINCNRLNRVGVMSPLYTIFRVHNMNIVYLEYFFKSKHWHSFMNLNGDTGARFDRFSIKDSIFFEMPIPIPYLKEQQKIGELFSKIDSLITLHQYMYNKLFQVKNDIFPRYSAYYSNILHNFLPIIFTYAQPQYKSHTKKNILEVKIPLLS